MIYINGEEVKPYLGDYKPLTIYKGTEKLAGWVENTISGIGNIQIKNGYSTMKVKPFGKSEQVQTEQGKNLLPINIYEFESNVSKSYTQKTFLKKDVSYKFSYKTEGTAIRTFVKNEAGITIVGAIYSGATINVENDGVYTFVSDRATPEVVKAGRVYDIQLEEGTVATEFEPFTPDSPSPDYPSPIENVSGDLEIKVVGKNLARVANGKEKTEVGIPIIKVEDDTIKINGTCEIRTAGQSAIKFSGNNIKLANYIPNISLDEDDIILKPGEYKLKIFDVTGEISNQNQVRFGVKYQKKGESQVKSFVFSVGLASNNEYSFTLQEESQIGIVLNCIVESSPITFTNVSFKCGLYRAAETMSKFEPYKEQSVTLNLPEEYCSLPNGVKDSIEKINDTWYRVQRIKKFTFDGTENWSARGVNQGRYGILNFPEIKYNRDTQNLYCNKFKWQKANVFYSSNLPQGCIANSADPVLDIQLGKDYVTENGITNSTLFKNLLAQWYDDGEPLEMYCELAEPIYTEIVDTMLLEKLNAIENLKTYRTVTNISNSQDTNMKIMYKINN